MDGVYLLYASAAAAADPAVIVLTAPRRAVVASSDAATTVASPLVRLAVDAEALERVYRTYPAAFVVLVSGPPDSADDEVWRCSGSQSLDGTERHAQRSPPSVLLQLEQQVQQRTCQLTLAHPQQQRSARHVLHLSPSTAALAMQQQPWLKELHEYPRALCTVAQVAAALLLPHTQTRTLPRHRRGFCMSTAAVLEMVSQCEEAGDRHHAAALLGLVVDATCTAAHSSLSAMPYAAPVLPKWVGSGDGSHDHLITAASHVAEDGTDAELCIPEAHSLLTTAAATASVPASRSGTAPMHASPPASATVVGGRVVLTQAEQHVGGTTSSPPVSREAAHLSAASATVVHVLICIAVADDPGTRETVETSAADATRGVVRSLLRRLHRKTRASRGGLTYHVHLSWNGADVVCAGHAATGPSASPVLTQCSLEEALARLTQMASGEDKLGGQRRHDSSSSGSGSGSGSDGGDVAHVLHQAYATLRHVHAAAHSHRLRALHSGSGELASSPSAVVLLCVDERSLARWTRAGHPSLVLLRSTPLHLCLLPSAAAPPARLQERLCEAPWVLEGLDTLHELCAQLHGGVFLSDRRGGGGRPAAAIARRLHAWATATYRNVYLCLFSELAVPAPRPLHHIPDAGARDGDDAAPRCRVCLPAVVLRHRSVMADVRLWRGTGVALSASTPSSPLLLYDAQTISTAEQQPLLPAAEALVSQYIFAFARRPRADLCGGADGVQWSVSRATRVLPRLALVKPGPSLRRLTALLVAHQALLEVGSLVSAEVEHVESVLFALVATDGGRLARSAHVPATEREALAEAVVDALGHLAAGVERMQRRERALYRTLHSLLPSEALEGDPSDRVPVSTSSPGRGGDAALPRALRHAMSEVDQVHGERHRVCQQPRHRLGEPITPSAQDTSAAVSRLLGLVYLTARLHQVHGEDHDKDRSDSGSSSDGGAVEAHAERLSPPTSSCSVATPPPPPLFSVAPPASVGLTAAMQDATDVVDVVVPTPPPSLEVERVADHSAHVSFPSRPSSSSSAPQQVSTPQKRADVTVDHVAEVELRAPHTHGEKEGVDAQQLQQQQQQQLYVAAGVPRRTDLRHSHNSPAAPPLDVLWMQTGQTSLDVQLPSVGDEAAVAASPHAAFDCYVDTTSREALRMAAAAAAAAAPTSQPVPRRIEAVLCGGAPAHPGVPVHTRDPLREAMRASNVAAADQDDLALAAPRRSSGSGSGDRDGLHRGDAATEEYEEVDGPTRVHRSAERRAAAPTRPGSPSPTQTSDTQPTAGCDGGADASPQALAPAPLPPPPRDLRWLSAAAAPVSSLAALLSPHLPRSQVVTSATAQLRVARYAAGRLTVEVQDPSAAAAAAVSATPSVQDEPLHRRHHHDTPVAHLILLSVDTASGALHVLETVPCAVAPTLETGSAAAPELRSDPAPCRYSFLSAVPAGTAVAVVYVGLRRAAARWVTADDVLWVCGIAGAVACPTVDDVRVSAVLADGFTLHWASATTRVRVLVSELTAPPQGPHQQRRAEEVRQSSPAIITGLRSGSIYHVQLTPLPGPRCAVVVHTPSQPSPTVVQLDTLVDAGVEVRAVLAATSITPDQGLVRVRRLMLAQLANTDEGVGAGAAEEEGDGAAALWRPHVTGRLECPRLHCCTGAFPVSLLRHCRLPANAAVAADPKRAPASLQLSPHARLHLVVVPVLELEGRSGGDELQLSADPSSSEHTGGRGGRDSSGATHKFSFVMDAGEEVELVLSLRLLLSLEYAPPPVASGLASASGTVETRVTVFDAVQPAVQRVRLGPFHVCRLLEDRVRHVAAGTCELAWEGTSAAYEVRVVKEDDAVAGDAAAGHATRRIITSDAAAGLYRVCGDADHAAPHPRFHATLRLCGLEPATRYAAHISCAESHVGAALCSTWCTPPTPPTPQDCYAVFDSSTRQLHLRFTRPTPSQQRTPSLVYEAVVRPLDTAVEVAASPADTAVVQRVLDCSAVPRHAPLSLEVRRRAVWAPPRDCDSAAAPATAVSEALLFSVVTDVAARAVGDDGPGAAVVELSWTCASGSAADVAAVVVLNGTWRAPRCTSTPRRLALTVQQLRSAAAAATDAPTAPEHDEDTEVHWWKGMLCVTAFDSAPPHHVLLVPDRVLTVLLPPPPPPPASMVQVMNYAEEALIDVDARELYNVYHTAYVRAGESRALPGRDVAPLLRQHIRLALEVSTTPDTVLSCGAAVSGETQRGGRRLYPLDATAVPRQRCRVPLHAYRPYDGQLRLALRVVCDGSHDGDDGGTEVTCAVAAVDPADVISGTTASAPPPTPPLQPLQPRVVRLLVPRPSSLAVLHHAIPPAEPMADITVTAITDGGAVVDWTPPLSLLRHLRRQPHTSVAYEVRLHRCGEAPAHHTDAGAVAQPTVYVTHEPHVCLVALTPATPYTVQVRGTGFGDYYGAAHFTTAPVVSAAVVAHVRASLSVEAVTPEHPRHPRSPCGPPRTTPALWAVLPASDVVAWRSAAVGCSPDSSSESQSGAGASVTLATHYTAALVAPTGEVLRRWTSSPGTTTTMFHEWGHGVTAAADGAASAQTPPWPHLEIMAHAELVYESGARWRGVCAMPDCTQSGVHRRTRIDLVGMVHVAQERQQCGASPACTLRWGGSSLSGCDVSWCISAAPHRMCHTTARPATAATAYALDFTASMIHTALSDVGGVASAPLCLIACISSGISGAAVNRAGGVRQVRRARSNTACVAWLLLPDALQSLPSVSVLYRTATLSTLLLPAAAAHSTSSGSVDAGRDRAGSCGDDAQAADWGGLERRYTLVAPVRRGGPASDDDSSVDRHEDGVQPSPWTTERCLAVGLPPAAAAAAAAMLVDVRADAGSRRTALELRCVDTVRGPCVPAWQQLSARVAELHAQRFSRPDTSVNCTSAGTARTCDDSDGAVQLRWLASAVEARRTQHLTPVCSLSDLIVCAVEDAGTVCTPRLESGAPPTEADGAEGQRARRGRARPNASRVSRPPALRSAEAAAGGAAPPPPPTKPTWLPLVTAPSTAAAGQEADRAVAEAAIALPLCISDDGAHDGADVDAGTTQATLDALASLQAWTRGGHPTLRARLAWRSTDSVFTVRVAGPYERLPTAAAAAERVGSAAMAEPHDVRRALLEDRFPTVAEMPHQRTYTCRRESCSGSGSGDGGGGVLYVETDGTVRAARRPPPPLCVSYTVEVDGLLPEALYRVQVSGACCGDAVLRAQLLTPPSHLAHVVTIGEMSQQQQQVGAPPVLSPAQQLRLHARFFNPHAFLRRREDGAAAVAGVMAPGLHYTSRASLEVVSIASGRRIAEHETHTCGGDAVDGTTPDDAASLPTAESECVVEVEEAVRVVAVHRLSLSPQSQHGMSFLRDSVWGPLLLWPPAAADTHDLAASEGVRHVTMQHVLCEVPRLPRISGLAVRWRTPQALQLTWEWWPGSHGDGAARVPSTGADTVFLLRSRRVHRALASGTEGEEEDDDDAGDVCVAVAEVCAKPVAILAPLHPGSLYEVEISEMAVGYVADARAAALRRRGAAASTDAAGGLWRGREQYAIQPAPLPPALAAAVRALALVSARPSSLVVLHHDWRSATAGRASPRGVLALQLLTPPAAAPAPAPRRRVRRRPGRMLIPVPAYAEAPVQSTHVHASAGVLMLSYTAVVVVPERVLYVPARVAEQVRQWWSQSRQRGGDCSGGGGGAAVGEPDVWRWWAERTLSAMQQPWWGTSAARRRRSSTGPASGEVDDRHHWNVELQRQLLGDGDVDATAGAATRRPALRVAPVEVRRPQGTAPNSSSGGGDDAGGAGGGASSSTTASWQYVVPITEPTYHSQSAELGERSDQSSRTAYVVHVVEALPLPPSGAAHISRGHNIVGGRQLITVAQAPCKVRRLRLVRDLRVRGTTAAATAAAPAQASLRVQWAWPAWQPSRFGACVVCTPLPASAVVASAVTALAAVDANADGAVLLRRVDGGVHAVDITGLAPATLYRVALTDVHMQPSPAMHGGGDGGGGLCGEDVRVCALTPPPPLLESEVPALRYRLLRCTSSRDGEDGGSAALARVPPRLTSLLGVEVCFQLPAALWQSQGLRVLHYAVLLNRDAVDVDACCSAEDFMAAAQEERAAPHQRRLHHHRSQSSAAPPHGTEAETATLRREAPVVYRNTSTQQRLRTVITLRRPMQQRYALAFFTGVHARTDAAAAEDESGDSGGGTAAAAAVAGRSTTLYSAVTVVPVDYTATVRAAYHAAAAAAAATSPHTRSPACTMVPAAGLASRWRRLLLRPTRLYVQERTRDRLVLRWQLDVAVLRLSAEERRALLRHGKFVVSLQPDSPSPAAAAAEGSAAEPQPQQQQQHPHESPARLVYYRSNTAAVTGRVDTGAARAVTAEERGQRATVHAVRVCDYRTATEDTRAGHISDESAAAVPSHLPYELVHQCPTYAAAHVGYTATVTLLSGWATATGADDDDKHGNEGGAASTSAAAVDTQHAATPTAAEYTSLSLLIAPVQRPLPVRRVTLVRVCERELTVEWDTAEAERPAAFALECVSHSEEQEQERRVWITAGPQQPNSATLSNLTPRTTYTVCVVPHNIFNEPCTDDNATVTVQTR
ncbi:Fibronectin type III domain containing protein [Novymonas esmeraldas]|uniref:Fibronectin type III domain containing protein n=1 Tax=Novymonas esmeraldas TaxID=1808958 RepID=A0AAW0EL51_9TRYP